MAIRITDIAIASPNVPGRLRRRKMAIGMVAVAGRAINQDFPIFMGRQFFVAPLQFLNRN
jgi:hypothetical protein